ncbi:MAG: hypothetical protein JXD19_11875 [Deltaproteobacteria bacterium]|nr:hypothetical protein [Deltaproteobacteria bacterium]
MKKIMAIGSVLLFTLLVCVAYSAYHHEGEQDADKFLAVYPEMAGTKLDHCALCHTGGQYETSRGVTTLGSCQWCHYSYGYDGSGNIVDTLNQYGKDYLLNGRNAAAIQAIDSLDSDGDGYTNAQEIQAKRFPGSATDDPSMVAAPYKVYTKAQLEAMAQHSQFLLMNTSRSGDFYAEYTGVPMEDLLQDAGILETATDITVYAPDGWAQNHPLDQDPDPELYQVNGTYPQATYYYDAEADTALNPVDGWCDYSAPSCQGRNSGDLIVNPNGNKMILAFKREGAYMDPGIIDQDNKLDGEGPFRVVPPQKTPSPPDQSSRAENQNVVWPYDYDWDHNAGASSRSVTIVKVSPLPPGTTDIDVYEAGWNYIDQEKIIIYGAISSVGFGSYDYYVPYFVSDANSCTGLGLRNCSGTEEAAVSVVVFNQAGDMISKNDLTIPANGQDSFLVGNGLSQPGWIKVNADQPLVGVCFTARGGANSFIADIPVAGELSTTLYVPHVAQNNVWDTTILVCNPNNPETIVNLKFVDADGNERYSRNYTIPANGSGAYDLSVLVQGAEYTQGSVKITATQGVAAFVLYSNLDSGGMSYAGVAAVSANE